MPGGQQTPPQGVSVSSLSSLGSSLTGAAAQALSSMGAASLTAAQEAQACTQTALREAAQSEQVPGQDASAISAAALQKAAACAQMAALSAANLSDASAANASVAARASVLNSLVQGGLLTPQQAASAGLLTPQQAASFGLDVAATGGGVAVAGAVVATEPPLEQKLKPSICKEIPSMPWVCKSFKEMLHLESGNETYSCETDPNCCQASSCLAIPGLGCKAERGETQCMGAMTSTGLWINPGVCSCLQGPCGADGRCPNAPPVWQPAATPFMPQSLAAPQTTPETTAAPTQWSNEALLNQLMSLPTYQARTSTAVVQQPQRLFQQGALLKVQPERAAMVCFVASLFIMGMVACGVAITLRLFSRRCRTVLKAASYRSITTSSVESKFGEEEALLASC